VIGKYVYKSTGKAVPGQPFKPGQLIPTDDPLDIESILYLDATCLRDFSNCREFFRRRYVENVVPKRPALDKEYGIIVHRAIESFWGGKEYNEAYGLSAKAWAAVDLTHCTVKDREKYERLADALPEVIGVYYEEHGEAEGQAMLEYEWVQRYPSNDGSGTVANAETNIVLCGRIDRYSLDAILYDVKTASEIGRNWKSDYKEAALRDIGVALYDWYLCQVQPDSRPRNVVLEVLVKPYRDKRARYEAVELPELVTDAYRNRFKQQLDFRVRELSHWWRSYQAMKPWVMSDTACVTRYGLCDYITLCNRGDSERNLKLYKPREEHLCIRQ